MSLLRVIKYGHPTLRKVAEAYEKDQVDKQFIDDMLETMYKEDGVGLAAPQVNVSKKMLVCTDGEEEYVLFNPEIIAHSESQQSDSEGCLSLPGLHAHVPRYEKVIVSAKDKEWNSIEIQAKGLLAVVLQHEIDHLNGILYIDRADLATLSWNESDVVESDKRGKPTTIKDIQTIFLEKYFVDQSVEFYKVSV